MALHVTSDLREFVTGYVDAALWSESIGEEFAAELSGDRGEDVMSDQSFLDVGMSADDLAPEARASIEEDCRAFIAANADDLSAYCEAMGPWHGSDSRGYCEDSAMARAGHDFLLTRNGHGCGYWDRELGELGDRLTSAAKYGETYFYAGDDGRVYVA